MLKNLNHNSKVGVFLGSLSKLSKKLLHNQLNLNKKKKSQNFIMILI